MAESLGRVAVVIEDDDHIRELITDILEKIGLDVIAVSDAADGIEAIRERQPTIVTLDINLPGIDGFEAARRIRAISQAYIVMVTARNEEIDTLQGLGAGADDFVAKPFRPRELRARVEAMLRRPREFSGPHPGTSNSTTAQKVNDSQDQHWLTHNGLRLEPESRLVELDGIGIDLTQSEFDLLWEIMESGRKVREKSDLALLLRNRGYVANDYVSEADRRSVEVHISNLRKKLNDPSAQPRIIETVRGIGYRLTAPAEKPLPDRAPI
ncbi:MAG: response regulator transcription factor [Microbacteriaceae bacterium]|nr:response regulator transcription factor [Microbacteriaceae bacterium]